MADARGPQIGAEFVGDALTDDQAIEDDVDSDLGVGFRRTPSPAFEATSSKPIHTSSGTSGCANRRNCRSSALSAGAESSRSALWIIRARSVSGRVLSSISRMSAVMVLVLLI